MPVETPTSDLQFLATVLLRMEQGDRVGRAEKHRLEEIATHGHTVGNPIPSHQPQLVHVPEDIQ